MATHVTIHRRNGKVLHTFLRTGEGDFPWVLADPMSIKFSRSAGENGGAVHAYRARPGMPIDDMHLARAMNPRISDAVRVGRDGASYLDLGDGIPEIRDEKLYRILDGLADAGVESIDSDGLIRLITARRR